MNDRFVTIESLQEQPDGVAFRQHEGDSGVLRRSHPQFARLAELLRLALSLSDRQPWPIYARLAADGDLVSARPAMRGSVLGASQDTNGGYSVGLFAVSTLKRLQPDHPDFERLKGVLLGACAAKRDIFYALIPGDPGVLADAVFTW